MTYTTHGLMTSADIDDHNLLYDTGRSPECPGHDDPDMPDARFPLYCSRAQDCPDAEPDAMV